MNWKTVLVWAFLTVLSLSLISSNSILAQSISLPDGSLTNNKYCTWFGGYWDGEWTSSTIDAQNDTVVISGVISGISLHDAYLEVGFLTDRQYDFIMDNHPTEPEDWFNQGAYMLFYTWTSGGDWSWAQIQDYQEEGDMVSLTWATSYSLQVVFKPNLGGIGGTADLYVNGILVESDHVYGTPQTPGWWSGYDTSGEEDFSAAHLIVQLWANDSGKSVSYSALSAHPVSPPTQVWVDDDFNSSTPGWGYDHFDRIEDGVDSVAFGGTVNVAAGIYAPFTVDSKSVSVEGQSGAVVTGNQTVSTAYGDRTTIVFLKSSLGVNLTGIEVQGPPSGTPRYGVIVEDTRGNFTEGVISPNNVTEWSNGCAIGIWGNSIFHLTQDTVRSFGKGGIFYYGANVSGHITDCVVEAPVLDDSLRLTNAVEADYGATVEVSNTEVFNSRNLHPDPEWASVGIMSYGYGVPTTLTVMNSYIHDNDYGVWVEDGSAAQAQISRNDIAGNIKYGAVNQEASFLNAPANWWGDYWGPATGAEFASEDVSALPSTPEESVDMRFGRKAELVASGSKNFGTGDAITENVAYSPWLGYAVGTTPMTYLVDTTGAIQEGIDSASEADSVRVLPGTYVENIVIDRGLALLGEGRDSVLVYTDSSHVGPPSGPSFQGSQMVVVQADNVLIDGFTCDGDNPTLTPVGTLDARNGIISNHTLGDWDNLKVRNCSVNNVYLRAIYPSAQGSVSGIEITGNTVHNAAGVSMQSAGIMLWGASGTITNNRIGVASYGIFLQHASDGDVSFNSADSCELGIGVNGNDQPTYLVSNKITDSNQGIQTIAINAEVGTSNDTVLGCRYGMVMYGLGSGFNTVDGNLFDGRGLPQALGFYISNYTDWGAGDVRGNLTNNQIVNNWVGIVLNESAADTTEDVLVTIGSDSALYNLIYDNDSSELYLEYCNDDIDATYNYWGASTILQIEQEIFHQPDVPSLGLVSFSQAYLLGDVNLDRVIDLADVVYLINYLYRNGPEPSISILGDANRDDVIEIGDVVLLINYLYRGGPPPLTGPVASGEFRVAKSVAGTTEIARPVYLQEVVK